MPTPAIRNLIRDDKVHQIYSTMQTGQEKLGMQTMNQSLATLYMKRLITLRDGDGASSNQGRAAGDDQPRRRRRRRAPGCARPRAALPRDGDADGTAWLGGRSRLSSEGR